MFPSFQASLTRPYRDEPLGRGGALPEFYDDVRSPPSAVPFRVTPPMDGTRCEGEKGWCEGFPRFEVDGTMQTPFVAN